jgi:hypothetical protein
MTILMRGILMSTLVEERSSGGMHFLIKLNNFFMLMTHKFTSPAPFCPTSSWMSYGHTGMNISKAELLICSTEVLLLYLSFN